MMKNVRLLKIHRNAFHLIKNLLSKDQLTIPWKAKNCKIYANTVDMWWAKGSTTSTRPLYCELERQFQNWTKTSIFQLWTHSNQVKHLPKRISMVEFLLLLFMKKQEILHLASANLSFSLYKHFTILESHYFVNQQGSARVHPKCVWGNRSCYASRCTCKDEEKVRSVS